MPCLRGIAIFEEAKRRFSVLMAALLQPTHKVGDVIEFDSDPESDAEDHLHTGIKNDTYSAPDGLD